MPTKKPPKSRYRLSADVPERTQARVRETAGTYYRGVVSDAVTTALDTFQWIVDARSRGKRVIAVDPDVLPEAFEELVISGLEPAGAQWTWLIRRDHPWRRQLFIKGRNMAAGVLARTASLNGWSAERTADEFDLPLDAVREAFAYADTVPELIDAEEAENRMVAKRYEHAPLPR